MGRLDKYDRKILNYLDIVGIPQTTKRIAERTQLSWKTTKDHLTKLYAKGYVKRGKYSDTPTIIYWRINK